MTGEHNQLKERLELIAKAKGLTHKNGKVHAVNFQKACGLPKGSLGYSLAGVRALSPETIKKVADAMGISRTWLAEGIGEMIESTDRDKYPGFEDGVYEAIRFARVVEVKESEIASVMAGLPRDVKPITVFLRCYKKHTGFIISMNIAAEVDDKVDPLEEQFERLPTQPRTQSEEKVHQ